MQESEELQAQKFQKKKNEDQDIDDSSQKCPNCGANVQPAADICEVCGEWLLKGKCNFCYTDVEPGQKFCAECGNSPEGVVCNHCGQLSHFDFCKNCDVPLTDQAQAMIEKLKALPELKKLIEEDIPEIQKKSIISQSERDDLIKMKAYADKCSDKNVTPKNDIKKFDVSGLSDVSVIINNVVNIQKNEEKRTADEKKALEEILKSEEETKKVLAQIQQKPFANNQEARRYYGALKVVLPVLEKIKISHIKGWRCNAFNCLHSGGPSDCAEPGRGGEWEYTEETIEGIVLKEVEI